MEVSGCTSLWKYSVQTKRPLTIVVCELNKIWSSLGEVTYVCLCVGGQQYMLLFIWLVVPFSLQCNSSDWKCVLRSLFFTFAMYHIVLDVIWCLLFLHKHLCYSYNNNHLNLQLLWSRLLVHSDITCIIYTGHGKESNKQYCTYLFLPAAERAGSMTAQCPFLLLLLVVIVVLLLDDKRMKIDLRG